MRYMHLHLEHQHQQREQLQRLKPGESNRGCRATPGWTHFYVGRGRWGGMIGASGLVSGAQAEDVFFFLSLQALRAFTCGQSSVVGHKRDASGGTMVDVSSRSKF